MWRGWVFLRGVFFSPGWGRQTYGPRADAWGAERGEKSLEGEDQQLGLDEAGEMMPVKRLGKGKGMACAADGGVDFCSDPSGGICARVLGT